MRAVVCLSFDEPERLVVEERDTVPCGPGQVRVRVWASGVNFVDALFVQGRYQIRPELPFVPGSELSGEITELGDGVEGWAIGDRVLASVGLGGFVDETVLRPGQLTRIPDTLSFGQAATMGQSYATAWFTLTRRTTVQPGDWVVTFGAAGGVGLAVLDVARALGANTLAVASTPEKLQLCIERGAHAVIDSSAPVDEAGSVRARIREVTDGGAQVVVDPVGGALSEEGLRSLGEGGRLMVVGFASGTIPALPANQVLLRNRQVVGVDWGAWAMTHPDENAALLDEVMERVGDGALSPVQPSVYPLSEVAVALRDLLERRIVGKACLESRGA
jgi:NADPH:quinone reductase